MRPALTLIFLAVLVLSAVAQQQGGAPVQPAGAPRSFDEDLKAPADSPEAKLRQLFETRIAAEWAAIKSQNKQAYGDLLADDYEAVEVDGKGERTKVQAVNELADSNIANYMLWGFKMIPLGPDADFAIYEVTMQFPPKSAVRYSRLYISELWIKRAGEWKEVHSQETHVK
jgi:hypothetical protein